MSAQGAPEGGEADPAPAPSGGGRLERTIALVGMMGVGKSTVGRKLADSLGAGFVDSDDEIEKAAGLTVQEIFERLGEPEFRRGERRVIERLVNGPPIVLATGAIERTAAERQGGCSGCSSARPPEPPDREPPGR